VAIKEREAYIDHSEAFGSIPYRGFSLKTLSRLFRSWMSDALFSSCGPLLVAFVAVGLLFADQLTEKQLMAGSSDSEVTGEKISPDGKYLAFNDTANGMSRPRDLRRTKAVLGGL
jgi:hypothetical protein